MDILNRFQSGMIILKVLENNHYSVLYFNDGFAAMLGYDREELQTALDEGMDMAELVYPADRKRVAHVFPRVTEAGYEGKAFRMVQKKNNVIWVLGDYKRNELDGEEVLCISYINISQLIGEQIKLEESNNMWMDIANNVPLGMLIFSQEHDKTTTIAVNDSLVDFSNSVGYVLDGVVRDWSKEQLMMLFNQSIYTFCHEDDAYLVRDMLEQSKENPVADCRFRLRGSSDTNNVWIYSQCSSKQVSDGCRNYYVTFQNVTKEVVQEEELRENHEMLLDMSYRDALTGVKNRNSYDQYIAYCKKNRQHHVGIVFADVNGLKEINDTMGHLQGDHMISNFARILIEAFSKEHVFRISGDEFVVVIPNIDKMEFQQRMKIVLNRVFDYDEIASVGYIWKESVSDIKRRASQAEQLMYVEKQRYYEGKRAVKSKHRSKMLEDLMAELEQGRYVMYLQPKSNIQDTNIVGAEALVRKITPQGEVVSPYEFVPIFEQEKLISLIDYFILEEACKFLERLARKGNHQFKISVNMSRVTMAENDYIYKIISICNRYSFSRSQLEFEITESAQTMDNMRMEKDIAELKGLGFGVSLDDVGTEYSSFPMLTLDGIDTVKLDRSFIVKMKNPKVDKLISYIIEMSHDLGLYVIAEGVETDEDRQSLRDKCCDMYQGYLLSRPIPAEEFKERFLNNI
ncbi:MAG: EAL domain-containing protein [Lachnospiraceae bacterium]|nr:EAL domain-containing protein [Lachnospiraceae bacterium]